MRRLQYSEMISDENNFLYFHFNKSEFTQEEVLAKIQDIKYVLKTYAKTLQLAGFTINNNITKNPLSYADSMTPTYRVMFNLNRFCFTTSQPNLFKEHDINKVIIFCQNKHCLTNADLVSQLSNNNVTAICETEDNFNIIKNVKVSSNNTVHLFFVIVDSSMTVDKLKFIAKEKTLQGDTDGLFININMLKNLDVKYIYSNPDKYILKTTLPVLNADEIRSVINSYTEIEADLLNF